MVNSNAKNSKNWLFGVCGRIHVMESGSLLEFRKIFVSNEFGIYRIILARIWISV